MSGFTLPVASFDHDPPANYSCTSDSGHAVSGGVVYRGRFNDLKGRKSTSSGTWSTGEVLLDRCQADALRGSSREATLHQMQLFDTSGKRLSMQDFVGRPARRPALRHRLPPQPLPAGQGQREDLEGR